MRHDAVVEGVGETINQRMGTNGICTFGLVDDEPAMVVMSGSAVWIMTLIDDDGDETPVLPTIVDSVRYAGIERGQTSVRTRIGERGDVAFIERIEFTHERIRLTFTFAHREQAEAQALLTALAALS